MKQCRNSTVVAPIGDPGWAAVLPYVTPKQYAKMSLVNPPSCRLRPQAMENMFQAVLPKVQHWLTQPHVSVRFVFENVLALEGWIPPRVPSHIVSNDRFQDWEIINVTGMRLYWNKLFAHDRGGHTGPNWTIVRRLCSYLPGEKWVCQKCGWDMPVEDMHCERHCVLCENNHSLELKYHRRVPYVVCKKKITTCS